MKSEIRKNQKSGKIRNQDNSNQSYLKIILITGGSKCGTNWSDRWTFISCQIEIIFEFCHFYFLQGFSLFLTKIFAKYFLFFFQKNCWLVYSLAAASFPTLWSRICSTLIQPTLEPFLSILDPFLAVQNSSIGLIVTWLVCLSD